MAFQRKIPFALPIAEGEIIKKRAMILSMLCAQDEGFCAVPVRSIRSETLHKMLALYDELFFCGYIKKQIPDMDIISVGPNMKDIHSPDETLFLDSVERVWQTLAKLVAEWNVLK